MHPTGGAMSLDRDRLLGRVPLKRGEQLVDGHGTVVHEYVPIRSHDDVHCAPGNGGRANSNRRQFARLAGAAVRAPARTDRPTSEQRAKEDREAHGGQRSAFV